MSQTATEYGDADRCLRKGGGKGLLREANCVVRLHPQGPQPRAEVSYLPT